MTFTQPNYRYLRRHRGGRWNVAAERKLGDFKPWRNRVTFDVSAAQRIVRLESKDAIRKSPKFRVDVGRNVPRSRHHGVFPFDSWKDRLHAVKSEKVSSNTKKWIRFILDRFRFLLSSISRLKFALFEFFVSKSRKIFNDKKHICYIFSNNWNIDNVLLVQSNFIYFIILLYYFFREEFRIFLNNNVIEE